MFFSRSSAVLFVMNNETFDQFITYDEDSVYPHYYIQRVEKKVNPPRNVIRGTIIHAWQPTSRQKFDRLTDRVSNINSKSNINQYSVVKILCIFAMDDQSEDKIFSCLYQFTEAAIAYTRKINRLQTMTTNLPKKKQSKTNQRGAVFLPYSDVGWKWKIGE